MESSVNRLTLMFDVCSSTAVNLGIKIVKLSKNLYGACYTTLPLVFLNKNTLKYTIMDTLIMDNFTADKQNI